MYSDYHDSFYLDDYARAKQAYFSRTYGTMAVGLLVTFLTALATAILAPWMAYSFTLTIFLCVAELILVVAFSRAIMTASYGAVMAMFMGYSCLNGVTLSSIFMMFDVTSIFMCFLATAVAFGSMALFGLRTSRSLSSWRSTLLGGLIGILVLSVVGLFLSLPALDLFISVLGVLVFMGLTAYDNQKLSVMFDQAGGTELADRYAVYAALQLYLDFINLFIHLLSIMARSRRN